MATAPPATRGFSPLDDELALLPGTLTPRLHGQLVLLGACDKFLPAARLLAELTGAQVSEPTSRRYTEEAGTILVACEEQTLARLEAECPPAPGGPAKQFLSADGVFVPMVGGTHEEVRTLALGEIGAPVKDKKSGEWVAPTGDLSYYCYYGEAEEFTQRCLIETQRRGTETAGMVVAVVDGAEWIQHCIDHHRQDALRILDFPHAAQRLPQIAEAVWGAASEAGIKWVTEQTRQLKEQGPAGLLAELTRLESAHPEAKDWSEHAGYLRKREAQMQYPAYRALGVPIGSGPVESGNKLVVGARLKQAGMHWAPAHLNPMLSLRAALCSDRWAETWPQIATGLRQQQREQQTQRRQRRQERAPAAVASPAAAAKPSRATEEPASPATAAKRAADGRERSRPKADHPWRRFHLGRSTSPPSAVMQRAKL